MSECYVKNSFNAILKNKMYRPNEILINVNKNASHSLVTATKPKIIKNMFVWYKFTAQLREWPKIARKNDSQKLINLNFTLTCVAM